MRSPWLPFLLIIALAIWAIIIACLATARAHSPEDTDPAMADWFRSLKYDSGRGWEGSCCSEKDCFTLAPGDLRVVDSYGAPVVDGVEAQGRHYEVRDPEGQRWLPVPDAHILKRHDNPTGKVVACVSYHQVLCLVRAAGI